MSQEPKAPKAQIVIICQSPPSNIGAGAKPSAMSDIEWADTIARNKEHIAIMLTKDFWTDEDLTPFETAIG